MIYDFDTIIDRSVNHAAKYDELKQRFGRENIIPLWIADMDFKVAQPIIESLEEKAKQGIFGYTSRPETYFESVIGWQKKRNEWSIEARLCGFNIGIVPAIYGIIKVLTQPKDSILFLTPVYSEFFGTVENANRQVLTSPLVYDNKTYRIDFEDFKRKLEMKPKLFILCNPHNPVGRVWSKDELALLGELCIANDVKIISDEIHSDLVLWGNRHTPIASISEDLARQTITCLSATKTFNLAGLQASTTVYPDLETKEACEDFWKRMDIHRNNSFSVVAMETAYKEGEEWLDQLRFYLEKNMIYVKNFIDDHLPEIKVEIPESTYLMWLDCSGLSMDDISLKNFMIHNAKLALSCGTDFGASSGFMRMNIACSKHILEKALNQLLYAVKQNRKQKNISRENYHEKQ